MMHPNVTHIMRGIQVHRIKGKHTCQCKLVTSRLIALKKSFFLWQIAWKVVCIYANEASSHGNSNRKSSEGIISMRIVDVFTKLSISIYVCPVCLTWIIFSTISNNLLILSLFLSYSQTESLIAMECFNSLLLKLQEVHEREVEGKRKLWNRERKSCNVS